MQMLEQADQLKQIPLFSVLNDRQIKLLAFTSEVYEFDDQSFLFHKGDISDCIYVVLTGLVSILDFSDQGEEIMLNTATVNDLIGEMAVLLDASRSASLRAEGAVSVLRIPNDRFVELIMENPKMALQVMKELSITVSRTSHRLAEAQKELFQYQRREQS